MISKKNKKMAMLSDVKKSVDEPVQQDAQSSTTAKSDAEENFEEFTPVENR